MRHRQPMPARVLLAEASSHLAFSASSCGQQPASGTAGAAGLPISAAGLPSPAVSDITRLPIQPLSKGCAQESLFEPLDSVFLTGLNGLQFHVPQALPLQFPWRPFARQVRSQSPRGARRPWAQSAICGPCGTARDRAS